MKRFIGTLVLLSVVFVIIVVGLHIAWIVNVEKEVAAAYTLKPSQKYLFLGSSQIGCGIEEAPQWENRVLWVSDTTLRHARVRLRELERRGQLGHLKAVVLPFNFIILKQYDERTLKWGWYQELPVCCHHFDIYPFARIGFAAYVASNLRWPFPMVAQSGYPAGRPAIRDRPQQWRDNFLTNLINSARQERIGKGVVSNWREELWADVVAMRDLCDQHGISLVVLKMPILPEWQSALPSEVVEEESSWLRRIEESGIRVVRVDGKCNLDQGVFFDSVHLNEPGTKRLTAAVMAELKGR